MLLSTETRRMILKIPFSREICNWIVNISHLRFYKKLNSKMHFDEKIRVMKDTHKGERCFIVGNGPSLTVEQLDKIKFDDSFGANRVYKMFDKTDWRPNYYVIQDRYDCTAGIYENLKVDNLFVSDLYWKEHGMNNDVAICYHVKRNLRQGQILNFSEDISKEVQDALTVTYTMIQLAVYLGYKQIYLIGMDHTYSNVTNDKGEIVQKNCVRDHAFDDKDTPHKVVANISYMEDAYRAARYYCEKNNIEIYNATIGGALEIFDRRDFNSLFNE